METIQSVAFWETFFEDGILIVMTCFVAHACIQYRNKHLYGATEGGATGDAADLIADSGSPETPPGPPKPL
jgi:hypothetical protein